MPSNGRPLEEEEEEERFEILMPVTMTTAVF
jgi:hypothetical protein